MIEQKAFSKTSNLQMIKIKNQNFYSIGDRILIGKSNFSNKNFDVLYFASRGIDEIIIPSTIKQNDSCALSNNLQVNIIDIKEDSKLMIQSIWLDFPKKYKKELDRISNPIIHKIYDKFQFKYYVFNEIEDIKNVIFNLFIYLVNFKFITFYIDKEKFNVNYKINCIFCIEGECIIIEEVVIDTLNNLIQKLVKHQISLINLSDRSIIAMEPHNDAKEEVKKFCKQFIYEIMKNDFLNYTIKPIVGYLIRRYFYPSNYFRDKSFFNFEQVISNEQSIKIKIKQFLFDDNIFRLFDDIIEDTKIFEKQRNDIKNSTQMFNEEDFIILRDIYSKNDFGFYYLVMHKESLYLFMMKKFDKSIVNEKDIQREIEFCQHSHRCFTPFYGFLMEKEYHNMTGLIYEFMSNGSLKSFVKENKFDEINNDIYLLMTINRIYEGIKYLHDKSFVHRDLKPSNILINHNNLAFISDFETIRSVDSSDPFTAYVGSPLYTSPEQDESNIVSYPTDIYSFGLIIYYLYEKNNMWSCYSNKKDRIKQITKCPNAIKTLYENCVQRLPENRIKTHEIRNALNGCFNTFSYLEEYLNDEKRSINDRYIIDFIFEKIFNQPINNKTSLQEQIRSFHQLFLMKIKESKLCFLSKTPQYEDITDYLNYINMDKNNSRTLNYIGINYMNGTGVEKNYLKAKEYF